MWRRGEEASISCAALREERCVVFDLGSLPGSAERTVGAPAVLGNRWGSRQRRTPLLIAVDEAHNVVPAVTASSSPVPMHGRVGTRLTVEGGSDVPATWATAQR